MKLSEKNTAQLRKLQIQENLQTKNINQNIKLMKNKQLENFISDLEHKRREDSQPLTEMFNSLKLSFDDLSMNVTSKEKIQTLDVEFYKNQMQYLQSQITKVSQDVTEQLTLLKKKEVEIRQELILSKVQETTTPVSKYFVNALSASPLISSNVQYGQDEIGNFQKFIAKTGGHTGGWGIKEHVVFSFVLKKWYIDNTSTLTEECISEIITKIPGITTEEILAHKIWWDKYCSLKFENNKALQKWKSAKDEEDKADKKMFIDIKKNSVILEKINDQQKKQYTQKLKLKIDQWKAEMNEKRTQDNNEKLKKYFAKRITKRRRINKEAVSKWLQKRKFSIDISINRLPSPNPVKKGNNKASIQKFTYFRKRDEEMIKKKVKLINNVLESKNNKKTELLKINLNKSQDITTVKSKYLEPTEQWCRRILKTEEKNEQVCIVNDLENIKKLAIPKWRSGISIR